MTLSPLLLLSELTVLMFISFCVSAVSLSSNVINAASQDPAVARLMNSSAAPRSPPSYPSSRCQIKTAGERVKKARARLYLCTFALLHHVSPGCMVTFVLSRQD